MDVTVGIDIGTSSVKAVAADGDGNIVARSRVPHEFRVPSPLRFEHDAAIAWHAGPQQALEQLGDVQPRAVSVAAMVPSLTAVDAQGVPCTPGLLYGDERGHGKQVTAIAEAGELMQFLHWQAKEAPDARGYWMAQAVANHALTGEAIVSTTVAATDTAREFTPPSCSSASCGPACQAAAASCSKRNGDGTKNS